MRPEPDAPGGASLNRLALSATVHCLTGCSIGEVLGMVIGAVLGLGNEIVDNAVMLVLPGAMDAGVGEPFFWGSLTLSLVIAGLAAFPAVRWLIARGRGHVVVLKHHDHAHAGHH